MKRTLISSPAFVRVVKRLTRKQPAAAAVLRQTLLLLEADALDARLRTHKLKGELADRWACSAGYDLRIVFRFVQSGGAESILLLTVGTHDEVY